MGAGSGQVTLPLDTMRVAVLLACLALAAATDRVRYDGFKVLEFQPRNKQDMDMIRGMTGPRQLDIIREPSLRRPGILMVSPHMFSTLRAQFSTNNTPFNVYIDDVQRGIDEETERLRKRVPYSFDADDFNDFDTIINQLEIWKNSCPDGVTCELTTIGTTFEGRPLRVLKIGKSGGERKTIWVDSAIHSREWVSIGTMQKIIDHLINDYDTDATVQRMVDEYDWLLLPLANPDGYAYTWDLENGDRLWRKNRQTGTLCPGTDLNRNFNVTYWGKEGVSHFECMDTYCGAYGASEKETVAIQTEMDRLFASDDVQMVAWVVLHGFGNMWMYPSAHTVDNNGETCDPAEHEDYMGHITNVSVNALEATNGRQGVWKRGSICETIYPVTGSVTEYAEEKTLANPYALELRGTWFTIDPSELDPSYREVWNGLVAMLDEIKSFTPNEG